MPDKKDNDRYDMIAPVNKLAGMQTHTIKNHLEMTEKVIQQLKKERDYFRSRSNDVLKERDSVVAQLNQMQVQHYLNADLEGELTHIRMERDRIAQTLDPLQAENRELKQRCAQVEEELAQERKRLDDAHDIIMYLEAQIEEFESIVNLMQEHVKFNAGNKE